GAMFRLPLLPCVPWRNGTASQQDQSRLVVPSEILCQHQSDSAKAAGDQVDSMLSQTACLPLRPCQMQRHILRDKPLPSTISDQRLLLGGGQLLYQSINPGGIGRLSRQGEIDAARRQVQILLSHHRTGSRERG